MEAEENVVKKIEDALRLRKMFEDQAKSETRCVHNLLRDAFEPYNVMLESSIKKEGYFIFPDISLIKKRKRKGLPLDEECHDSYTVQVIFGWFLRNDIGIPEELDLSEEQEEFLSDIMRRYAEEIQMTVKYSI